MPGGKVGRENGAEDATAPERRGRDGHSIPARTGRGRARRAPSTESRGTGRHRRGEPSTGRARGELARIRARRRSGPGAAESVVIHRPALRGALQFTGSRVRPDPVGRYCDLTDPDGALDPRRASATMADAAHGRYTSERRAGFSFGSDRMRRQGRAGPWRRIWTSGAEEAWETVTGAAEAGGLSLSV